MTTSPLPREIIKWIQGLDLSFIIKNPKRDLANGFLVAEILSRHFPKEINMNSFKNETRLAAREDNWDQLVKIFKRKFPQITKQDCDLVMHCTPDAALVFILKLHHALTRRSVRATLPPQEGPLDRPGFMRDTAAYRLKDPELDRIVDKDTHTYKAIDILGTFHEERRLQKEVEAPLLLRREGRLKSQRPGEGTETLSKDEHNESVQIDEVRVKSLQVVPTQLTMGSMRTEKPQLGAVLASQTAKKAAAAPVVPRSAVGALASMQPPAMFVKPAAELLRPLVYGILSENDDLARFTDPRKDIVVSFMEQCRDSVSEEISVRVFETLANRAQLLVDTVTKSPQEFWRVWSTFYPALTDFPESNPVFEAAVLLFMSLGQRMREAEPTLAQQLLSEVGLPSLSKELLRSPEKREALCDILYSYTQEDTLNHILMLRALRDKLHDLPVYISCLSSLITRDAQLNLLDEHMLDLYIYYSLVALQSPMPKSRVAGVAMLSTIAAHSYESVVALIPTFAQLAQDDWWEVQAQLLLLAAELLSKVMMMMQHETPIEPPPEDETSSRFDSPTSNVVQEKAGQGGATSASPEELEQQLLDVISRLFVVGNSKNVLQVGLSALVDLLPSCDFLQPMYVAVLLKQPAALRRRLLRPSPPVVASTPVAAEDGSATGGGGEPTDVTIPDPRVAKLTYVYGNASRMYEERCVCTRWPHLEMAKTFVKQLEGSPLEHWDLEHMEVFLACVPEQLDEEELDEPGGWFDLFEKVKQYVFVALVDPDLHSYSAQIIRRFWLSGSQRWLVKVMDASKTTLLQALGLLYLDYQDKDHVARVDEAVVLDFLRDLCGRGEAIRNEVASILQDFRESHPAEYQNSQLPSVLGS